MEKLIPVADKEALKENNVYFTQSTLYKMKCTGEKPEIFTKIGRRLFIIKSAWDKYIDEALQETQARAEKIKELKGE